MLQRMKKKKKLLLISAAFIAPALILYAALVIYPIFFSGYLSFTSWKGLGEIKWCGLDNYLYLFKDDDYLLSLRNTLMVTGLSMLIQVPMGLILAYLLFRTKSRIFKVYRAVYFLPVVIASTAIATMFRIILNNDVGVFNRILESVGLGKVVKPWLSDSGVVIFTVIFVQIWQYIGTYVIIFLAAYQSIDDEIFESARMDGANCVQQFFLITCPLVKDIICVAVVLCFTGSMKSFDIPFIMTAGGPGYASSYLGNYMYKEVFSSSKFGRGAAVTVTILVISFAFTLIFNHFTKERKDEYGGTGK